ncbi:CMRF35-like molecule 8 [Trachinotus anak]|uniref:CMRF35-like molecule 8 n=1 Tax=Trachinotus anak TaxID=443729 RepID=UPI0039F1A7D7
MAKNTRQISVSMCVTNYITNRDKHRHYVVGVAKTKETKRRDIKLGNSFIHHTHTDWSRMIIHHVLLFFYLSGIHSGDSTLITATEGQSVSFEFPFTLAAGSRRYLCKEECTEEDVLITTHCATAQEGRYSIRYHDGVLKVTIEKLRKSDSGRYRCGVRSPFLPDSYEELVEIRVAEVDISELSEQRSTEGTRHETGDLTTFPTTIKQFEREQTEDTTATALLPVYPLVVCVCGMVVGNVLLAVWKKWKTRKESDGLKTRENFDNTNTEVTLFNSLRLFPTTASIMASTTL